MSTESETSTSIVGSWDVTMKTPIGTVPAVFDFTEAGGVLSGRAESKGDTVPLTDLTSHGDGRVTWNQVVTKPMRLNLAFDVTIDGDTFTGFSKAGRLPRSTVKATRR